MNNPGRLLIGVLLLAAGILFLLDVAEYVDGGEIIGTWWPLAVIAFGLVSLMGPARSIIGGGIVILVGLVLLIATLGILPVSAGEIVLPLILIAVGLGLLFVRAGYRGGDPHNTVNGFAVFGGQDIVSRADRFTGGSLTAIFGGATLDLRQAALDSEGAQVETFAAFGGIDIIVPRGWRVTVSGMPLFGAFEDHADRSARVEPETPTFRVSGIALFGGIEVKHKPD